MSSINPLSRPGPSFSSSSSAAAAAPEKHTSRLYVGNLHHSVDEYALVQLYSKYGKIVRLEYIFHKAGPNKGKPKGYAFVEFGSKDEALRALVATHDKLLRGRKLIVTHANVAPTNPDFPGPSHGARRARAEPPRPTTLSLLKNQRKPETTDAKIAALEAKLASMSKSSSSASFSPSTSESPSGSGSGSGTLPKPPPSAGLPARPTGV